MAKEYFIIVDNKVLYEPGHYEFDDAKRLARQEAKNNPGTDVRVMHLEETYCFDAVQPKTREQRRRG